LNPSMRVAFENLMRRKICLTLLEEGSCPKKSSCRRRHPEVAHYDDVANLFSIISGSFPQGLPKAFGRPGVDPVSRLKDIYNSNKGVRLNHAGEWAARREFVALHESMLKSVAAMEPQRVTCDFLRTLQDDLIAAMGICKLSK